MREHGAFILARYSTDSQNADTIEVQVGKCSEWCSARGLPILGVYADYAVSGMKDTRPQYEAMMAALRQGGADTVVIYDQSRMFRLMTAWFEFRAELEQLGVSVVSVTQPLIGGDLRDPANFMNEGVTALFNQMWALQTRQKVVEKMRHMAKNGQHTGGKPPLGYRVEDGRLVIDETEAKTVRRIFEAYASGQSYKTIIDALNRDGLKTKRGNPFGTNSLHDLLKNERYTGVFTYGGRPYRSDGSRNSHAAPDSGAVRVENANPAIISRELFDRVQARMADNRRQQGGRPPQKREYPLKGKVFCGECGSAMSVSTSLQIYDYYKCTAKKRMKTDCPNTPIPVDRLEQLVADAVRTQLGSPQLTDRLVGMLRAEARNIQSDAVETLSRLQQQDADISRRLSNAMDAILDGLTSPALKKRVAELETQQRTIRAQLKDLRQRVDASVIPEQQLRGLLHQCAEPQNAAALLSIVSRVEVYADHVEIYTLLDPTPTNTTDYTLRGTELTKTPGTASGVPTVFVTPQFLRIVVAR